MSHQEYEKESRNSKLINVISHTILLFFIGLPPYPNPMRKYNAFITKIHVCFITKQSSIIQKSIFSCTCNFTILSFIGLPPKLNETKKRFKTTWTWT